MGGNQGRRPGVYGRMGALVLSVLLWGVAAGLTLAAPQGEHVVSGEAGFERDGPSTVIRAADNTIIDYQAFDIAAGESVRFIQPEAVSRVLNRVRGGNPSDIYGSLTANGLVYLVNPGGVYFHDGCLVDVGGIYAAAAQMSNEDFLNDLNRFTDAGGEVVNWGTIRGDAVHLVGARAANFGDIAARNGIVTLAAGEDVLIGRVDGHFFARVEGAAAAAGGGAAVENEGSIDAAGGRVALAAGDMYALAIRNTGRIAGREVALEGQGQGTVEVSGEVEAPGGTVEVMGDELRLAGARIDVSAPGGGGTVLVGGESPGEASSVAIDAASSIRADALAEGDGGFIAVRSASVSVQGTLSASKGSSDAANGLIVIDPAEVGIVTGGSGDDIDPATIVTALDGGSDFTVEAEDKITVTDGVTTTVDNGTTLALNDEDDPNDGLTIDLDDVISLQPSQTLTGEGTTVNVASTGSLQNGIDVAADSATVEAADGTYTEDLVINKPLTLQSQNGMSSTTIQLVDGVGIEIGGAADNFTLGGTGSGFTIQSGAGSTFLAELQNAPSGVTISHSEIDTTGNATMGISVGAAGADQLTIADNTFTAGDVGDGSVWGPSVSDLTVSDNTLTGPAALAGSGYALQFSGVTGTSSIEDNTVSDYANGILISNGPGVDGLTITGNDVSSCTNGIRFADYSPGTAGNVGSVSITNNTLTDNETGLLMGGGSHLEAGTYTITGNQFSGSTEYHLRSTGAVFTGSEVYSLFSDGSNTYDNASVLTDASNVVQDTSSLVIRPTIQQSIDAASGTEIVQIAPGTYDEAVTANNLSTTDTVRMPTGAVTFNSTVTLQQDAVFTASDSNVTFGAAVSGTSADDLTVDAGTGNVTFNAAVGAGGQVDAVNVSGQDLSLQDVTSAGAQTYTASGTINLNSTYQSDGGDISFSGDTVLNSTTTVDTESGGGNAAGGVDFSGATVSAAGVGIDLSIDTSTPDANNGGAVGLGTFNNASGGSYVDHLDVDSTSTGATDGTITLNNDIRTASAQTYTGPVALAGAASLIGPTINFDSTLDGGFDLDIAGSAVFDDLVGDTTPLSSLEVAGDTTFNAAGTTANPSVETTGLQSYGDAPASDAVTLNADTVLTAGGTADLTLDSAVDGNYDLELNSAGTTSLSGAVGGVTALSSVTTDAAGTTRMDADVTTAGGAQTYGDDVLLGDEAVVTLDATDGGAVGAGADITIGGTVDVTGGASDLYINAGTGGTVDLQDVVGADPVPTNVTVLADTVQTADELNAASSISITADTIALGGNVTSAGDLTLQPYTTPRSIGIAGGAGDFNLDATEVGYLQDGFNSVTIGRADGSHAVTVNAVTFNDPVTIQTPSGGSIAVDGQITGADDAAVALDGPDATTTLNADIVTEGNAITISDNVLLGTPALVALDTTDGGAQAGGANVTVTGTVDDTGAASGLAVHGGTGGTVQLQGHVGGTTPPASLTVSNAAQVDVEGMTTTGDVSVTGTNIDLNGTSYTSSTGALMFDGAVDLDSAGVLTVTGGGGVGDDITFTGGIEDSGSDTLLAVSATPAGDVDLQGDAGAGNPLDGLNVMARNISLHDVTTTGDQNYSATGLITLSSDYTGWDIAFNTNRAAPPGVASICQPGGDVTINATDDFVMAQNDKFSVVGDLTINANEAWLSDLSVLGDLDVNAPSIYMVTRDPTPPPGVLNYLGNYDVDIGLDFVIGGGLVFSSTPVPTDARPVTFATPAGGPLGGSLAGYTARSWGPVLPPYFDFGGQCLDLSAGGGFGPLATALAGVAPEPQPVATVPPNPGQQLLSRLKRLGIFARTESEEELIEALIGFALYDSVPAEQTATGTRPIPEPGGQDYTVASPRLSLEGIERAAALYEQIFWEQVQGNWVFRGPELSRTLERAVEGYRESNTFQTQKEQLGREQVDGTWLRTWLEKTGKHPEALRVLEDLGELFRVLSSVGLTRQEFETCKGVLLRQIDLTGVGVGAGELEAAILE